MVLVSLLSPLGGCSDNTDSSVLVQPTNPYYVAARALSARQVPAGTRVGDCVINAFASCRGVDLSGQYLQGAFLAYSDLRDANLAGATFCNTLMPDATVRNPVAGLCPGQ